MERISNKSKSKSDKSTPLSPHGKFTLFISPISRKTSSVLEYTLDSAVKEAHPTLYLSLEMGRTALTNRLIEESAGIDVGRIQDGLLSPEEFHEYRKGAEMVARAPLYIQDYAPVELDVLESIVSEAKTKSAIEIIVIDYPALLKVDGVSDLTQRLMKVCMELSRISKIYNITVVGTIIQPRSGSIQEEDVLTSFADEVVDLRLDNSAE
jgi:replicative DNA helicase